jgi:two-component system, OmpR family, response regulator MtrA
MEILAVLDDLFFSSKISSSLEPLGHSVRILTDPSTAINRFKSQKPALVIVDLGLQRGDPFELIRDLKREPGVTILAYTNHMDTAGLEKAREAGADKVVSRSLFSGEMAMLVDSLVHK